ncbi:MAG: hypothetical protein RQM92_18230 [Candidatus Syntrophopropionicum ammoniitolerans]
MMCIDSNCGRKEVDTEIDELLTKHKNQPGSIEFLQGIHGGVRQTA